ncbi:MAG: hypothetical protein V5A43_02260 [Haloarculaceae archaeon]
MTVDLQSLETVNRLAHAGAQEATESGNRMTGIDASVHVTRLSLVDRIGAGEALGVATWVRVISTSRGRFAARRSVSSAKKARN